ncbi:MAG: dTDP-4-dehydrorhamnose reductase [Phycisphaeraceae bacterium]
MKRILLLGSNGQLGSDLIRAAQGRADVEITPLCRDDLDVTQPEQIVATLGEHAFDVLINGTSYHKTDEVEANADQAVAINAHAVREMARACGEANARFVHVSTDYVFDGRAEQPYREDDATGPLNVYGAAKRMGETLAQSVHDDVLIFRVASLFGIAGASGKGGNFVETMIRVGREKGALRVIADQFMSPTATADVAEILLTAICEGAPAGIYHAVNSGQASWFDFASQIIQRAGIDATVDPIPATEYPLPAARPAFSVLDNTKISDIVGPIPHWTDALDRYLSAKGHTASVA